jgi:hypothetical protein
VVQSQGRTEHRTSNVQHRTSNERTKKEISPLSQPPHGRGGSLATALKLNYPWSVPSRKLPLWADVCGAFHAIHIRIRLYSVVPRPSFWAYLSWISQSTFG